MSSCHHRVQANPSLGVVNCHWQGDPTCGINQERGSGKMEIFSAADDLSTHVLHARSSVGSSSILSAAYAEYDKSPIMHSSERFEIKNFPSILASDIGDRSFRPSPRTNFPERDAKFLTRVSFISSTSRSHLFQRRKVSCQSHPSQARQNLPNLEIRKCWSTAATVPLECQTVE